MYPVGIVIALTCCSNLSLSAFNLVFSSRNSFFSVCLRMKHVSVNINEIQHQKGLIDILLRQPQEEP